MALHASTNPTPVDYFRVPRPVWRRLKTRLPRPPVKRGPGRPAADPRPILHGIWYVLWTGCPWKAVHRSWFGGSSSVIHDRFQTGQQQGLCADLFRVMVRFYNRTRRVPWPWQAVDSRSCPAPLGGAATGKTPTDRATRGSKVHILVDQRGAPWAVYVPGAHRHDKGGAASLIIRVMGTRPGWPQHCCADRAYDAAEVHATVTQAGDTPHSKHRRRRNERRLEPDGGPGERSYPARRWVVERTLGWMAKRRSLKLRWCKKAQTWLALVQCACAHILCDLAIYG